MARIEGIRYRLENWARWCAKVEGGALGFPTTNSLARLAGRSSNYEAVIPTNDVDAAETDAAVKSLQLTRSHLYLVLTLHYAKGLPIHRVAREMHRAESTIKRNLEDADLAIQTWLVAKAEKQRSAPVRS
ncbi:hypothetical protein AZ34_11930 [Hylemonella gracilis str. Niagara R]|uniref:Antitermination protein Q n=1 Tax=Hylemonella gracilis str. Niagara R TaxID=1458275 RepID=A0A016XIN7_9BURK|nr:antiterminator Q family protein [Hylemonella gracilis]EYC51711.1 hypothetical protein AZ34_11930 [Hylemonella gracilis str. Niagara R]